MSEYFYQGLCPASGRLLTLPRSPAAMAAARGLMSTLEPAVEGKMLGVLLVDGAPMLKAFSGRGPDRPGWVSAIPCESPLELATLHQLEELRNQLEELNRASVSLKLVEAEARWTRLDGELKSCQRQAKKARDQQRSSLGGQPRLEEESRADKRRWRQHKALREAELGPLRQRAQEVSQAILELKRQRRALSATLQADMHRRLCLFPGQSWSLASLFPAGPPTGTGECCAPKLLYQAALQGLRPLAMAEFWWGPPVGGRVSGEFYAACETRCQPLIGPLLSCQPRQLTLVYVDDQVVAVEKPAGVLTLPGRGPGKQDCLWERLKLAFPEVRPIHRLDLDTTGIVLFARTPRAQGELSRQFAQRQVDKSYLALLSHPPAAPRGTLDLALGKDSQRPGCYRPDPDGQKATTEYERLDGPRVLFRPHTGRSHQLRVHAAFGLGCPIQGDRLYGGGPGPMRLHAWRLAFQHPESGRPLLLESQPNF